MRKVDARLVQLFLIASIFLISGCDRGSNPGNKVKVLKLGYTMAPMGAAHEAAEEFARLVNEKTAGKVQVKLYPSAQLGTDRELAEGLTFGSVDLVLSGLGCISSYVPEYEVLEAPFLFRDYDHLEKVVNGKFGEEMRARLREVCGIEIIDWWFRGPRYLTAKKPIKSVSDLRGMKLRVPKLPTYIKAWEILGANPTPITYSEMFMALKQGTVEGQENPLEVIYTSSLHEVQGYIMETKHLYGTYMLLSSKRVMDILDDESKTALRDSASQAGKLEFELMKQKEQEYREKLKEEGMEFIEVKQSEFRKPLVEKLPKYFKDKWAPDSFQRIQDVK